MQNPENCYISLHYGVRSPKISQLPAINLPGNFASNSCGVGRRARQNLLCKCRKPYILSRAIISISFGSGLK
jgi:hypothetical protein